MFSRGFLFLASVAIVAVMVGCSSQGIAPSSPDQSGGTLHHPMGEPPNGGGTSGGGNGATATPTPTTIGTITVHAYNGVTCYANSYYCDGAYFTGCIRCFNMPVVGGDIAKIPPTKGASCWNSPGQLGYNLPANTSGPQTQINNIEAVWTSPDNTGTSQVAGWIYQTGPGGNGAQFFQLNPDYHGNFWNSIVNNLPGFSSLANFIEQNQQGVTPLSNAAAQALLNAVMGTSGFGASCFTGALA